MADNVLGVLFQDIADAIRAKTGGTETMKPAEFPAEIAAIETGGGGGGGVVLDELYWTLKASGPSDASESTPFVFKNELYFWCEKSRETLDYEIYKYTDGEYSLHFSYKSSYRMCGYTLNFVEVGNELHIIGGMRSQHLVWDGSSTITQYASLDTGSDSVSQGYVCVFKNELYARRGAYADWKLLKKWDRASDTWNTVCEASNTIHAVFVWNNKLCISVSAKTYYVDVENQTATLAELAVIHNTNSKALFTYNNNVYYYNNRKNSLNGHCCLELYKNGEMVGNTPFGYTYASSAIYNGKIYTMTRDTAPYNSLIVSSHIP